MKKRERKDTLTSIFLGLSVVFVAVVVAFGISQEDVNVTPLKPNNDIVVIDDTPVDKKDKKDGNNIDGFEQFGSADDLKEYLAKSDTYGNYFGLGTVPNVSVELTAGALDTDVSSDIPKSESRNGIAPDRMSGTNVQVVGIDEPDIVKTDGEEVYVSSESYYIYPTGGFELPVDDRERSSGITFEEDMAPEQIYPYPQDGPGIKVVKALPLEEVEKIGKIEHSGNLLLSNEVLVIFEGNTVYGYNVEDPRAPLQLWRVDLEPNTQFVEGRLYDDKIYLLTRTSMDRYDPCPIRPLRIYNETLEVSCDSIYHPSVIVPVNYTYTLATIQPGTGAVLSDVSFVGSYGTKTYMSENSIYVAYVYTGDMIEFTYGFFKDNTDLFPKTIIDRLAELNSYDISQTAKFAELEVIFTEFERTLDSDERLRVENEVQNRMQDYLKVYKRNLQKTDIVKIDAKSLETQAVGTVSGRLLNQFSMDEYEGHLRVAVTISSNFWGLGIGASDEDANDVYVLDDDMKMIGSVRDLGLDERIYAVRFIKDKGYLVTFKQIDPFYVLDLRDPKEPKVSGELKIPGYSSYLHPINKDLMVGIGKEDSKVKISLFDVADPSSPREAAKYTLNEYWSEVLNTHHAFLIDTKHQIFFMPGSKGGYVFSYKNDRLELVKAVSGINARRALYIGDYLYIVGEQNIVVLDENKWERVVDTDI